MRHRNRGRKLGRNSSHRKAMFRNMAASLIKTAVIPEDAPVGSPKVAGRIVTTVPKAKELRPIIERLITLARKAIAHETAASEFATDAARQSEEWKQWRASETWQKWRRPWLQPWTIAVGPLLRCVIRKPCRFCSANSVPDLLNVTVVTPESSVCHSVVSAMPVSRR